MPLLALVMAMALWASTFVILKWVFVAVAPLWVICARMWIAALALLALRKYWGKADYRAGDWRLFVLMSLAEPCLYFVFEAKALLYTSASQAGMVTAVLPMLTVAGAVLFLGEQAGRRLWLGLSMAVAGVIWLSADSVATAAAPNPVLGNSLEFLAMLCAALYSLSLKRLSARYSPLWLTAIQAIAGALFFLPLAWFSAPLPGQLTLPVALAMLYLGLGVTLGAYGLYNFAMARLPAARVAVFVNLIPLFSLLLAWLWLDERLSMQQSLACALVLTGVMFSQQNTESLAERQS